jgi:hypothetical protein
MERFLPALLAPLGIVWLLASSITYVLLIVDTWQGTDFVVVKLLVCITFDVFFATIWPITWILWIAMYFMGKNTPLHLLFG